LRPLFCPSWISSSTVLRPRAMSKSSCSSKGPPHGCAKQASAASEADQDRNPHKAINITAINSLIDP
jgi:hypothetical protein